MDSENSNTWEEVPYNFLTVEGILEERTFKERSRREKRFNDNLDALLSNSTLNLLKRVAAGNHAVDRRVGFLTMQALQRVRDALSPQVTLSLEQEKSVAEALYGLIRGILGDEDGQEEKTSNARLNDLGQPMHPLEAELLDIMDGLTGSITHNGYATSLEYYSTRVDKKETPLDFFNRVYHDHIQAGVIYQDYLRKIDPRLISGLRTYCYNHRLDPSMVIPPKSVRTAKIAAELARSSTIRPGKLQAIEYRNKSVI